MEPLSDEALCALAAGGERAAEELLVSRHARLVRSCARPFFLYGGDSEDLIQEGMIGLLKAIREFRPDREASFRTFAEICIRNRYISLMRSNSRDRQMLISSLDSTDPSGFNGSTYPSGVQQTQRALEDSLITREYRATLLAGVRKQLSDFEAKILTHYLDGYSCREIAELVGRPVKSVDNAVQRIRHKIALQKRSGESSES